MIADPRSVAGKQLSLAGRAQVLIVGAGPAGIAAARAAHAGGARVVLVDEHPIRFETMGENVPQFWGGGMGGAVRNRNAAMERLLEARPALAKLFEAGVDVRLGCACWGLFANQRNLGWMPGNVAGLIDETGSTLLGFDQAIVATGRRDMALAFPGWDQPGVMGAGAAVTLARLYGALDVRCPVMLGASAEALAMALELIATGVRVAAIVEQASTPPAPDDMVARVRSAGVELVMSAVPRGVATGGGGITGLVLADRTIACDGVLVGVGAVPMIDLPQAAGARTVYDNDRGGFVPVLDEAAETSLAGIRAVGDCAGIWHDKSAAPRIAEAEGRLAANAALAALGLAPATAELPPRPASGPVLGAYRKAWVRATILAAPVETPVCQCEDVTARDILEVSPPRYLDAERSRDRARKLTEILGEGPPDPEQIKRLTRAGMGPCQGRRCREQVQALLALQDDLPLEAVPLAGYRAPVRPIPLARAVIPEDPATAAVWDSWFGMPRQWVPFWEVEREYTVASLATEKAHVSE